MKRLPILASIAIATLFAASATAAQREEPVAVNVEGLAPQVAERVKKHAAEGKSSLIRYVNATQFIHGLRVVAVAAVEPTAAKVAMK
jgi:hypothetical protein